ncbi:MAG: NTP transferase domain-containing protein [Halobacteriales archaeon]
MCGGTGTRLDANAEKPLFPVAGRPMVDRVLDALFASHAGTIYAVVSPEAPETRDHVEDRGVETVETPGEGYVADLDRALGRVGAPALTVSADLPLLEAGPVDRILDAHGTETPGSVSLAVCVPAALKRLLGLSVDATMDRGAPVGDDRPGGDHELAPTGVNVVGGDTGAESDAPDRRHVTYDARLAVNVNRIADAKIAEALA